MRASLVITLALSAIAASANTIFPRAYPRECLINKYLLVFSLTCCCGTPQRARSTA